MARSTSPQTAMNTLAFIRSPLRLLPLALLVTAMGAWASQDAARATVETASSRAIATIAPYGAVAPAPTAAPASILPYGAMSHGAVNTSASVLPYGAITHDVTTEAVAILPYGAVSPRLAP